jgi:hypothetical protein
MESITLSALHDRVIAIEREVQELKDVELTDDDLEFHQRVREAWKEVDEGKVVTRTKEEFLAFLQSLKDEKGKQLSTR